MLSSSVKIPRFSKQEMSALKVADLAPVRCHPFTGQTKSLPPTVAIHSSRPYHLVKKFNDNLDSALEKDISWVKEVIKHSHDRDPEAEWSGFMASSVRKEYEEPAQATNYVFGLLLNFPPSHPDTVLTTLTYIETFMQQHEQAFIHVCADMQLYKVAMQIKWSFPERWKHLVVCPGGMHTDVLHRVHWHTNVQQWAGRDSLLLLRESCICLLEKLGQKHSMA